MTDQFGGWSPPPPPAPGPQTAQLGGWSPPPPPAPEPPTAPPPRRRPLLFVVVAVVAVLAVAAGIGAWMAKGSNSSGSSSPTSTPTATLASESSPPSEINVNGTLELHDAAVVGQADAAGACTGTTAVGYGDISEGAEVVITNDRGATLEISQLSAGSVSGDACDFTFSAIVPAGLGFYGVEITHRGIVKFAEADMSAPALTLGI